MLIPQKIIAKKRDGLALDASEIDAFIQGLTKGEVSDAQVAAFAMSVYFQGMNPDEIVDLTRSMVRSGTQLDWRGQDLAGPIIDKHSTGGIGDNVSLMLAPMLAAVGGFVPMISGRGLGHTGGTLDKLDSIPGYQSTPDLGLLQRTVRTVGAAIIGQTAELAPADRKLYAIRDVTASVESLPLITASILSKKVAAGLDALILDVKVGNGSFMGAETECRKLAKSLVRVANGAGVKTSALLSNMDQPLASSAGNAVEAWAALDFLTGTRREPRLLEVTLRLGAELMVLARLAKSAEEARVKLMQALENGEAAERFQRMSAALGGPHDLLENYTKILPSAPIVRDIGAPQSGFVTSIDCRSIGMAVIGLGGGRRRAEDKIDHSVGFTHLAALGGKLDAGQPMARVHALGEEAAARAEQALQAAFSLGGAAQPEPALSPGLIGMADL